MATFLFAGLFSGIFSTVEAGATVNPACTTTHTATTCKTTLTIEPPAGLGVHGNTANPLAAYNTSPTTFKPTTPMGTGAEVVPEVTFGGSSK
jgi:hypothetical protein